MFAIFRYHCRSLLCLAQAHDVCTLRKLWVCSIRGAQDIEVLEIVDRAFILRGNATVQRLWLLSRADSNASITLSICSCVPSIGACQELRRARWCRTGDNLLEW